MSLVQRSIFVNFLSSCFDIEASDAIVEPFALKTEKKILLYSNLPLISTTREHIAILLYFLVIWVQSMHPMNNDKLSSWAIKKKEDEHIFGNNQPLTVLNERLK